MIRCCPVSPARLLWCLVGMPHLYSSGTNSTHSCQRSAADVAGSKRLRLMRAPVDVRCLQVETNRSCIILATRQELRGPPMQAALLVLTASLLAQPWRVSVDGAWGGPRLVVRPKCAVHIARQVDWHSSSSSVSSSRAA